MRIDEEQFSHIIARYAAEFSQRDLKPLAFRHGVGVKQVMHCGVRRQEWKPVEDLETAQRHITTVADSLQAQGGLVN